MNLEYGSGVATWFWVGVSLECSWTMGQGYSNLKALPGLQDLLPMWLTHMYGEFGLVVGGRFQFLPAGKSPEGYLSMPTPWQLLPHENSPRERKWEATLSLWLTFGRHSIIFVWPYRLHRSALFNVGGSYTRMWKPGGEAQRGKFGDWWTQQPTLNMPQWFLT